MMLKTINCGKNGYVTIYDAWLFWSYIECQKRFFLPLIIAKKCLIRVCSLLQKPQLHELLHLILCASSFLGPGCGSTVLASCRFPLIFIFNFVYWCCGWCCSHIARKQVPFTMFLSFCLQYTNLNLKTNNTTDRQSQPSRPRCPQ